MTALIVVPCYNEASRIRRDAFLEGIDTLGSVNFLFVNDGSTDETQSVLESLASEAPTRMEVFRLEKNSGKAEAVRQGVLRAIQSPGTSMVGYWDADLATPLDEIPFFIDALEQKPALDMVLGARVRLLGHAIERKIHRHVYGRAFATVTSNILDLPVCDTQCGAKLMRNTPLIGHAMADPFMSRWVFDVELLARMLVRWRGDNIDPLERLLEVPLRQWRDVAGSKIGPMDAARAIGDLWQIERVYGKALRPR